MMATGNIPWRRATQGTMAPACMQTNPNWTCSDEVPTLPEVLKLLSFNIQVGINTQRYHHYLTRGWQHLLPHARRQDRKSTRLNSSHVKISYAVFCLKKKNNKHKA